MPSNFLKTGLLLVVLTAIFVSLGALIGGKSGLIIAFVIAMAMNFFSYWNGDRLVLRMYGCQEVDANTAPEYHRLVAELAARAGLPMPRTYIMDNPQPNAFATGRSPSHAAVCASTGLLDMLDRDEVAGVIAHELTHIKNRDTLTMTVAAAIAGAISMVANMLQFGMLFGGQRSDNGRMGLIGTLVAIIVAPFAAMLVQMAISRSREYQADRGGAEISGMPLALASALQKIESSVRQIPNPEAEAAPATAHLFIINPLTGQGMDNLFSTHPNTDNRIAELERLAAEMGATGRAPQFGPAGAPWSRPARPSHGPWG